MLLTVYQTISRLVEVLRHRDQCKTDLLARNQRGDSLRGSNYTSRDNTVSQPAQTFVSQHRDKPFGSSVVAASFAFTSSSPSAASSIENAWDNGVTFFDGPVCPALPMDKPPLKLKVTGLSEVGRTEASTDGSCVVSATKCLFTTWSPQEHNLAAHLSFSSLS